MNPDTNLDMDPDHDHDDSGKTCLGGGIHCPSASSIAYYCLTG